MTDVGTLLEHTEVGKYFAAWQKRVKESEGGMADADARRRRWSLAAAPSASRLAPTPSRAPGDGALCERPAASLL